MRQILGGFDRVQECHANPGPPIEYCCGDRRTFPFNQIKHQHQCCEGPFAKEAGQCLMNPWFMDALNIIVHRTDKLLTAWYTLCWIKSFIIIFAWYFNQKRFHTSDYMVNLTTLDRLASPDHIWINPNLGQNSISNIWLKQWGPNSWPRSENRTICIS